MDDASYRKMQGARQKGSSLTNNHGITKSSTVLRCNTTHNWRILTISPNTWSSSPPPSSNNDIAGTHPTRKKTPIHHAAKGMFPALMGLQSLQLPLFDLEDHMLDRPLDEMETKAMISLEKNTLFPKKCEFDWFPC